MASFGYSLSSEEHSPADLVRSARRAEDHGFDVVSISDHFHPWVGEQGHSPFAWSVLGAVAATTSLIEAVAGVTCPIMRTHPAILAHASTTTALLVDGRVSLGLGTGEALNGPDVEEFVDAAAEYVRAGYDHPSFHQIGPDQDGFFDFWSGELQPALEEQPAAGRATAGSRR